jgi:hypothetical protein
MKETCCHGVSLSKYCVECDDGESICDHDTVYTGELDEEDRKITMCKHCKKEFVELYIGKKRKDAINEAKRYATDN